MQADLYNLQPTIGEINGLRSNYQIAVIKGEKRDLVVIQSSLANFGYGSTTRKLKIS